jgi:hypothetical protein
MNKTRQYSTYLKLECLVCHNTFFLRILDITVKRDTLLCKCSVNGKVRLQEIVEREN